MNEKLMQLEISQQMMGGSAPSSTSVDQRLSDMQSQLDKAFEINSNKVKDMIRLKDYLQDLKIDFGVLTMNKQRAQGNNLGDFFEGMGDSDKMVIDQINNSIENLAKIIQANLKSEDNPAGIQDESQFMANPSMIMPQRGDTTRTDITAISEMEDYNIMQEIIGNDGRMDIEEDSKIVSDQTLVFNN